MSDRSFKPERYTFGVAYPSRPQALTRVSISMPDQDGLVGLTIMGKPGDIDDLLSEPMFDVLDAARRVTSVGGDHVIVAMAETCTRDAAETSPNILSAVVRHLLAEREIDARAATRAVNEARRKAFQIGWYSHLDPEADFDPDDEDREQCDWINAAEDYGFD